MHMRLQRHDLEVLLQDHARLQAVIRRAGRDSDGRAIVNPDRFHTLRRRLPGENQADARAVGRGLSGCRVMDLENDVRTRLDEPGLAGRQDHGIAARYEHLQVRWKYTCFPNVSFGGRSMTTFIALVGRVVTWAWAGWAQFIAPATPIQ